MGYIGIVDYGAGNLMSVVNSLRYLGCECRVSDSVSVLEGAERLILPGVGAFPYAMKRLRESGLDRFIIEQAEAKPLLGICLGMQVLFSKGYEMSVCEGLSLIPGEVRLIETEYALPHIGWNSLEFANPSPLLEGVSEGAFVYFVHSFCAYTADSADLKVFADYGAKVAAVVGRGNVYGCQFHPEKSGDTGLKILENFASLRYPS